MSDKQIDIRIRATNETGAATAQAASDIERFAQRTRDASGATVSFGQQASEAFGRVREAITGMIAAYVGVQSVQAFVRLSDEAALAKARLEQVTGSTEKAAQAQQALYDMAQRLQAPFKEVQQVFTRLMPAVEQLKGGAREATALSEIIVTTAKIAGASAAEAASSTQQFAQALGSGVLQGDELKSILENNQVLSRTLADALGVTVGELKKMGEEGKLTADVVGNALLGRFDEIKEKGKELPTTVGGAFTKVTNAVHMLISAMDASNGPLKIVIEAFEAMAEVIDLVCQELKAGQDEADKLGSRQEVVRALGRAFAWVADVVSALIGQIRAAGQAIGGLFAAANAAMQGNFSGAVDILKDAGGKYIEAQANFVKAVAGGGKIVQAHAARAAAGDAGASQGKSEFKRLEGGGAAGKDAKGGARRGGRGSGGSDDVVGRWRQELEAQKLAHAEQQREAGTHHKFRLEQEADFWREKLKLVAANSKEGIAARQAIVAIERQTYQERKQIAALEVSSKEAALQSELDISREQADHALEMGRITGEQRLELQIQFEEQRYQIAFQAWEERRKLLELEHDEESVAMKQHHEKLLEMQRRHQLRLRQLQNQMQEESDPAKSEKSVFGSMEKSMSSAFTAILTRTQSFRQAMQNMFKSIGSVFIDEMVSKPLAQLIMRQVRESAIWQAIFGQQIAGQAAASATTTGMKTAETTANVTMDATQAAAGAAKSQAGIPYVGPVLAAAAMAAMLAMVMGLLGGGGGGSETTTTTTRIPSAAGGWDIPAGINPLTQLHEREMVLPAEQADAVRRMASGGDAGQQPVVINATGGDWVHKNDIVKLLRTLRRDYRLR